MLPLIPLAISFVPELVRLIAGDKAGTVAASVAAVVSEVTGTSDPVEAQQKLAQDPAIAANLRIRLAEIAVEAQKVQNEDRDLERQADLKSMQTAVQDTVDARANMRGLAESESWIAWVPAIVSFIVTGGFFAFIFVLLFKPLEVDDLGAQIINIAVGALTASFATVINFWLGSSKGSRDKDEGVLRLQASQATQTSDVIQGMNTLATKALSNAPALRTAVPAVPTPPPPQPIPASDPAKPAAPGLLAQVMPSLTVPHKIFDGSISWMLTAEGISADGAPPRGTAGDPTTVQSIWARYGDDCAAVAKHYGVPVELIVATIATESGGDQNARRPEPKINDESIGLMQTLVGTARGVLGRPSLRGEDLLTPRLSIEAGTAYIAQQRGSTHFDPPLVAAAYNAGSLRRDDADANRWRLLCYPTGTGQHVDRFVSWFADAMQISKEQGWAKKGEVPSFLTTFS